MDMVTGTVMDMEIVLVSNFARIGGGYDLIGK